MSTCVAVTKRKVRPGLPFTRPGLQQPRTVGAAGIVPNNRIKHPNAAPSTPDLTKDRPIVWPAHIPHPDSAKIAHVDSTQRRQAAPRLHCKAFEFPAKALVWMSSGHYMKHIVLLHILKA